MKEHQSKNKAVLKIAYQLKHIVRQFRININKSKICEKSVRLLKERLYILKISVLKRAREIETAKIVSDKKLIVG